MQLHLCRGGMCDIKFLSLLSKEAQPSPSIGNTLWRVWTTFTRSTITPPEVNGFGWNLGHSWVYCLELAQTDFGHDPRRSESESSSRFFVFFCHVTNARLYRFLVRQISQNLHTSRGSAMWWILSERNFQSLPTRGRFFPKCTFLISSRMTSDFRRR